LIPNKNSTGILTCFPSTTPFGLVLGPDSPPMDEPSGGTQRFSGHWIHTNVFVTQADILTSALSIHIYMKTSPKTERSPTDFWFSLENNKEKKNLTASADYLVPAIVGAKTLYQ
jgi:hypothetical protein